MSVSTIVAAAAVGVAIGVAVVWVMRRRARDSGMSASWLYEQAESDTKRGWEGPRWRFPAEVQAERADAVRRERLARAAAMRRVA